MSSKSNRLAHRRHKVWVASASAAAWLATGLIGTQAAQAATFYWDSNAATAGFGNATGTWAQNNTTTGRWSTSSNGSISGSLTQATTSSDVFNFGSGTDALGAGTITVSGSVTMGNTTYSSLSGAIVLSGGTINYVAASTITVNNTRDTINSTIGGAGTSLTKAGIGTLVLGGTNTYTGNTIVSDGILAITGTGSLPGWNVAGRYSVQSGAGLAVYNAFTDADIATMVNTGNFASGGQVGFDTTTADRTYTVDLGTLQPTLGLTKSGANKLTLTAANTWTGGTTLSGGTLALSGGNNRLSTGSLAFTGTSTLDLGSTSQTLASITVPDLLSLTATINGTGGTLNLNGASNLEWGPGGNGVSLTADYNTVVNLGGLSTFIYNAPSNTFRVGLKLGTTNTSGSIGNSTVTLAASNTITAVNFNVADVNASSSGGTGTLHLGAANTLNVGNINVGFAGRSNALLDFSAAGSAVTIRNVDGTSAVTSWGIGKVLHNASSTWTDTVDLTNGTVDALVSTMTIGSANTSGLTLRAGTVNGSFTMGNGSLTVAALSIGEYASTGGGTLSTTASSTFAGNGVFTLNNAAGIVNASTLTLGTNTGTATLNSTTPGTSGTFNLTNGTLKATTVQKGAQTGNALASNVTVAFNWTNGTISNLASTNLTWTDIPITLFAGTHAFDISGSNSATVNSGSPIGGGAFGITKLGTGTLTLSGANTYSGPTTITGGTLALSSTTTTNNIAASTSIIVAAGATLDVNGINVAGASFALASGQTLKGNGSISGPLTIASGSTISPGSSTGLLTTGDQTWAGGGSYRWEVNNAAGTAGSTTSGFDTITMGLLNVTATGVSKFTIAITSLDSNQQPGQAAFDLGQSQSWVIANTTGIGGNGVGLSNITLDTSGFLNDPNSQNFSVTASGNNVVLNYTAAPEPGSIALAGIASLGLLRRRRQCLRR